MKKIIYLLIASFVLSTSVYAINTTIIIKDSSGNELHNQVYPAGQVFLKDIGYHQCGDNLRISGFNPFMGNEDDWAWYGNDEGCSIEIKAERNGKVLSDYSGTDKSYTSKGHKRGSSGTVTVTLP